MQTTLIILKPDAVQRSLMGRIISRFEDKGLQIVGAKLTASSPRAGVGGPGHTAERVSLVQFHSSFAATLE